MEKLKMQSKNLAEENVTKIRTLFPNCVTEGKIDFDLLRQELSSELVEGRDERYRLEWAGKRQAILTANSPIAKTLRPVREESVNFDTTENVYIEGDNLDVLKLLHETYLGRVKMIYIDPPYNTGKDFVYKDDFAEGAEEYLVRSNQVDEQGNRMLANKDTSGRYHSDWLSMMYMRLKLARDLLTDDGVIFMSIDDNEQANLKKIGDEIFGDSNFYGQLIQLKGNTQNDSKSIQRNHEYILCYVKNNKPYLLTYGNKVKYEVFEDAWYLGRDTGASSGHDLLIQRAKLGYTVYYIESTGNGVTGNNNLLIQRAKLVNKKYGDFNFFENKNGDFIHAVAVVDYDVKNLNKNSKEEEIYTDIEELIDLGYKKIRPPLRKGAGLGCWTWALDTFKEYWNNNEVKIKNGKNVIRKVFVDENDMTIVNGKKYFIKDNTLPLKSIIEITNSQGTVELKSDKGLLPGIGFDNPKSIALLKYFLCACNDNKMTVLDFFSGSATTAHAVMQLNAEDGGNRKFIMVQIPEEVKDDERYKTICEIGKERIRRAGRQIVADLESKLDTKERAKTLDTGFRVFRLADSNMREVYYNPKEYTQDMLIGLDRSIKEDRTAEDVLIQVMLDKGVSLSSKIERRTTAIGEQSYYIVGDQSFGIIDLICCLDNSISTEAVKEIAKLQPECCVFLDSGMSSDATLVNLRQVFDTYSPKSKIEVI